MENNYVSGSKGPSRRAFLSASAVTAVAAAPLVSVIAPASAASASVGSAPNTGNFDPALRALIRQIDPNRIQATIEKLVSFGTRHTLSSQTDPVRGIGAATAWVFQQMQGFAAASNGNMTVQQQTFTQPAGRRIPVPITITNVIATLQGTASPERFYVVTGHLDSRVTDVLNFTERRAGRRRRRLWCRLRARTRPAVRHPPVPRHHRLRHRRRGGAGTVRLDLHGRSR